MWQLKKELDVDDKKAPVISSNFISFKYSVFDEKEVQQEDNNENHFLADETSFEKSAKKDSLKGVQVKEDRSLSSHKDAWKEKDQEEASKVEKEIHIFPSHKHYKDLHKGEGIIHQSKKKDLEEETLKISNTNMQPKCEVDENIHLDKSDVVFIPG